MAVHCGECGSTDCTHGADTYTCLRCGARTNYDGDVVAGASTPGMTTTKSLSTSKGAKDA